MAPPSRDRLTKGAAAAAVPAIAVATLVIDGEVEVTLFMLSASVTFLICFDTALARRVRSFWPWLLLGLAPIVKAAPTVWYDLNKDAGLLEDRYEHAGSALLGLCVLAAVVVLARPAPELGARRTLLDALIIAGTALAVGVAATSVAFAFDPGFGSVTAARWFEFAGWALAAAIVASVVAAISHVPSPSGALSAVSVVSLATAGCLAVSSAGRELDVGWWSFVFAGFAITASWFGHPSLGDRRDRTQTSSAVDLVAVVAGVIAAAAAIGARGDRDAWSPGWAMLGVVSMVLLGASLAGRMARERHALESSIAADLDRAPRVLRPIDASPASAIDSQRGLDPHRGTDPHRALEPQRVAPTEPAVLVEQAAAPAAAPVVERAAAPIARSHARAATRGGGNPPAGPAPEPLVVHHHDPTTGLLSAAGLQHHLVEAFRAPHGRSDIAMMLLAVRNLAELEAVHGRVQAATVTHEIADRLRTLVPHGSSARFARAAYAIVLTGQEREVDLIGRFARVLKAVGGDVVLGSTTVQIDVVAGMTQCYGDEDAARFVHRANAALERAVLTPEPALVAMP